MKTTNCPACAAPVTFRSGASILAVCEFCSSTLLRRDGDFIENLGKMAELMDDPTLIQIGTQGQYKGVHFGVIGRIQLKYEAGLWNEWHLLFDDNRAGWLGEAGGEFFVTFQQPTGELPGFHELKPQTDLQINGRPWTVTDLEQAMCIAGRGELPFKVGAGYRVDTADLRSGAEFATIDYSETPPLFFAGEKVPVASFKFGNLRDPRTDAPKKMDVGAFNCPSCAAPLKLHSPKIQSVGCASCGSVIDVSNPNLAILCKAEAKLDRLLAIQLGTTGKFDGVDYEAIGYMRRELEFGGKKFGWDEYLLFNLEKGFRWLGHSNGHWSLIDNAEQMPRVIGLQSHYKGERYEHFETYEASVVYVVGEFYWRVKVGDKANVADYVLPPGILSQEQSEKEVTWSVGRYIEPEAVQQAFTLKSRLPQKRGIAPNQPSPYAGLPWRMWKWFLLLSAIAIAVQMGFVLKSKVLHRENFTAHLAGSEQSFSTKPFEVSGGRSSLVVRSRTDLENSWAAYNFVLLNQDNGEVLRATRELAYYRGYDDGESWEEGNRKDAVAFNDVPPGRYVLDVDVEMPKDAKRRVTNSVEVVRGAPSWINWLLMQLLLFLLPAWASWRTHSYEVERWADSDHPKSTSSGDDDDDD